MSCFVLRMINASQAQGLSPLWRAPRHSRGNISLAGVISVSPTCCSSLISEKNPFGHGPFHLSCLHLRGRQEFYISKSLVVRIKILNFQHSTAQTQALNSGSQLCVVKESERLSWHPNCYFSSYLKVTHLTHLWGRNKELQISDSLICSKTKQIKPGIPSRIFKSLQWYFKIFKHLHFLKAKAIS